MAQFLSEDFVVTGPIADSIPRGRSDLSGAKQPYGPSWSTDESLDGREWRRLPNDSEPEEVTPCVVRVFCCCSPSCWVWVRVRIKIEIVPGGRLRAKDAANA